MATKPESTPATLSLTADQDAQLRAFSAELGEKPTDVLTRALEVMCKPAMIKRGLERKSRGQDWFLGRP